MKVREVLESGTKINYLEHGEDYLLNRVNIFNSDGSGRINTKDSLDCDVSDFFVEENNTINVYVILSIKGMRQHTDMSQKQFSEHFGLPLRTLQEWEQGRANPPSYLLDLLKRIWNLENH